MSSDSGINAALLNLCAQLQDGGARSAANERPSAPNHTEGSRETAEQSSTSAAVCATALTAAPAAAAQAQARRAADYEWLRSALASVESPEKRVKQLLFNMENLTTEGKPGPLVQEERLEALEELADMVEDVNWAAEFALMQGPQRLLDVMRCERAAHPLLATGSRDPSASVEAADSTGRGDREVQTATHDGIPSSAVPLFTEFAMIIAHSAQLNEPVQTAYGAAHWEDIILPFMGECIAAVQDLLHLGSDGHAIGAQGDGAEAANAAAGAASLMRLLGALLHACSCLCRDSSPNTVVFFQTSGLAVIVDVLRLTRTLPDSILECTAEGGRTPVVVTNIASDTASDQEVDDIYAPLLGTTRKVTARALFFVAYLASTGVSSEEIIQLTCLHAESGNSGETVQKAAAHALAALVEKSPKAIKEAVHALMPHRLKEWRTQVQRVEGDGEAQDDRLHFLDALERIS
ncbi:hypothetical protein CGC20_9675 [Leishmania donovani]|uniref:Uncharacterized protein n=1 Tax=Leishmania donovani TaxID=5661 RepID=A0A504WXI2_LEIDO|nr:hypothetical protein CGC20_3005 [Leishmania donovani]TPP54475.1 hypothetical protein CGC20_9665 [Leishmania donovani]TPP54476.1 hypothetical protein CGC20_9670 [Leishmania donovani]TPP54477.1 hypothetical protein CGC20_9675 [Leishmania donovani]